MTAIIRSHAKINLTLDVLELRPDGYHAIESVMQSISLHDTLTIMVGGTQGIQVSCDMPGIPADAGNLAYKAAELFLGGDDAGVEIRIRKRIPPEAGLGGGSSNAAAVLRGLSGLLGKREDLPEIAAGVGSDVPFFLTGGTALVRGRGEIVEPLSDIRPRPLLIVKPAFGVSTPWAYRRLDEVRPHGERPTRSERMYTCMRKVGCRQLPSLLANDLEQPVFERHPEIAAVKEALLSTGASAALMCGSGSAVYGIFDEQRDAEAAAESLNIEGRVFVDKMIGRREALDEP